MPRHWLRRFEIISPMPNKTRCKQLDGSRSLSEARGGFEGFRVFCVECLYTVRRDSPSVRRQALRMWPVGGCTPPCSRIAASDSAARSLTRLSLPHRKRPFRIFAMVTSNATRHGFCRELWVWSIGTKALLHPRYIRELDRCVWRY